jgi:putative DNA primase/helicase
MLERIDFAGLASAALDCAERLVAAWLPDGRRDGHEWKSVNPVRADRSAGSFSINLNSGAWGDFATDDKGGDLVSLCAYLFHSGSQLEAAYDVAEQVGFAMPERKKSGAPRERAVATPPPPAEPKAPRKKSDWVPVLPAPESAGPPPVAHVKRGRPERTWCYRDAAGRTLGWVYRFLTSDGGKEVLPVVWARHAKSGAEEWHWMAFGESGRPMYGLDRLAANPEATVLVVEGEKCADVGAEHLPGLEVVSWPGGGKAVDKVDWSALAGRRVVIWPDCDAQREKLSVDDKKAGIDANDKPLLPEDKQPGVRAARRIAEIALELGAKVWLVEIPAPGAVPSGWDIADAVADGLTGADLAAWVRDRSRVFVPGAPEALAGPDGPPEGLSTPTEAGAGSGTKAPSWRSRLLWTKQGDLRECLANVFDCLLHADPWDGVLAFDEFAQRTVKLRPPPYFGGELGEWEGTDDSRTAMWLSRAERFAPSSALVAEAIETLARSNTIHPVRAWIRALPSWDGVDRIDHWLIDCLGVRDTAYARKVARFFLIGMVARVMDPGVKFDYCLVLEGKQGKGKSTAARILGGDWYGDTDLDLNNKDSMSALRGKWVYEFAELGSVTRAESTKQKSFLSRQFDEFRPVYGRREIKLPRQCVFIGTTNEWEWNKDPTGGRRFWPVDCEGDLRLDILRENRDQLFAEALALYEAKERFWPVPEEQQALFDPEQLMREQQESLIDALHDWVFAQVADFSIADAAMLGLNLDAAKLTRDLQTRIGIALRKLGCPRVEKRNGMVRYWYKSPARNGTGSTSAMPAQHGSGVLNAPF